MPLVAVAGCLLIGTSAAVLDSQMQRADAVAASGIAQGIFQFAVRGIGLSIGRPYVTVAGVGIDVAIGCLAGGMSDDEAQGYY